MRPGRGLEWHAGRRVGRLARHVRVAWAIGRSVVPPHLRWSEIQGSWPGRRRKGYRTLQDGSGWVKGMNKWRERDGNVFILLHHSTRHQRPSHPSAVFVDDNRHLGVHRSICCICATHSAHRSTPSSVISSDPRGPLPFPRLPRFTSTKT